MIRSLRRHQPYEPFPNEVRGGRSALTKWVYLGLLGAVALWLLDLFCGPLLRLDADGLVMAPQVSASVPFPAQVMALHVAPGASVRRGDPLARVQSLQAAESIAQLTTRVGELAQRRAELAVRAQVDAAILDAERERSSEAAASVQRLRSMRSDGTVNTALWADTLRERAAAGQALALTEAELKAVGEQLDVLDGAMREAKSALEALRQAYADGAVTAPFDGLVGSSTAHVGEVLTVGQSVLDLYAPQRHVLAWLPGGVFYTVSVGQAVEVSNGASSARGRVLELLPVADRLPTEFQRVFRPAGRGQVVKVALEDERAFPLFAKVRVRAPWLNGLKDLATGFSTLAATQ